MTYEWFSRWANAPSSAAGHGFCGRSAVARVAKKVLPGPEDDRERHQVQLIGEVMLDQRRRELWLGVMRVKLETWPDTAAGMPFGGMDHLLLKATRSVTIALVSSRERKRQQPGLATDDPAFVGWHQLVRGIQGS